MGYVHQWTFRRKKEDVSREKVDIQKEKEDIGIVFSAKVKDLSDKTAAHSRKMFDAFGFEHIFWRSAVCDLLGLKNQRHPECLRNWYRQM